MRLLSAILRAPRLTALLASGLVCLTLTLVNFQGPLALDQADGFAEAVQRLQAASPQLTLVWPPHAAGALAALPPSMLATDALPAEPPERRRFDRIGVLGPAGFANPPELAAATRVSAERVGDVELRLFAYPVTDRVLFDLRQDLARAKVSLRGPTGEVQCDTPRPEGGFACPGMPEWTWVGPTSIAVEGNDWNAVWAHPDQARQLRIDLGEQTLGDLIEIEGALSDGAVLTPNGAPVNVTLEVGGEHPVTRSLVRSNQAGIARTTAITVAGNVAPVSITVTTPRDARRHFALNVRILARPGVEP